MAVLKSRQMVTSGNVSFMASAHLSRNISSWMSHLFLNLLHDIPKSDFYLGVFKDTAEPERYVFKASCGGFILQWEHYMTRVDQLNKKYPPLFSFC